MVAKKDDDSGFKVESMKYFVIPAAVGFVYLYQTFFKAKKAPELSKGQAAKQGMQRGGGQQRKQTFQELQEMEMEKKFAGLSEKLSGSTGEMGNLKKEMDEMKNQLKSLSSGTDGLTRGLKDEMDAMKAQIGEVTKNLQGKVGKLSNNKILSELEKKR